MSALGDQLRGCAAQINAIAAQVDALQVPGPAPVPDPPPPLVAPPPAVYTNDQIRAKARAQGYDDALVLSIPIPVNGTGYDRKWLTRDFGGFRARTALVIRFVAPPADELFQVTFVQTGDGINGSAKHRNISLATEPLEWAGPAVIYSGRAPNLNLALATMPSRYTRNILTPGREYFVSVNNLEADGSWPALERYEVSIAIANNRP